MKPAGWLPRLLLLVVLAVVVSGLWLFRYEIIRWFRPGALDEAGAVAGAPSAHGLQRAQDKIDSLQGWSADSVVLTPDEAASLFRASLPAVVQRHLDSVRVTLGTGRIRVSALVESASLPKGAAGPLAGALKPYEAIVASGPVTVPRPGEASWEVEALTLRGFTLPEATSRHLLSRAVLGMEDGRVTTALPRGVADLHIRPGGVALFPRESR